MDDDNKQNVQEQTENEKAEQAGKDIAEVAAKSAATYLGGPIGGKVADIASKTKLGQGILNTAGHIASSSPLKPVLSKAQPLVSKTKPALMNAAGASNGNPTLRNPNAQAKVSNLNSLQNEENSESNASSSENNNSSENKADNQDNKSNPSSSNNKNNTSASDEIAKKAKKITKSPFFWIYVGLSSSFLLIIFIFFMNSEASAGDGESEDSTSKSYSSTCEPMNFNSTSLTRDDFIKKVNIYYENYTSKNSDRVEAAKTLASYAGKVYDLATSNNINPELVYVRASAEGYSPGIDKNNFWGLGCTNSGGSDACITYATVDSGILGFINNISQYDSLSEMMKKYAYIGYYWFENVSGGASHGGCYYYNYIKDYMTPERSSEVANICQTTNCSFEGEGNCVRTTDQDQLAYSKWQVDNMVTSHRTAIFGLEPDTCIQPGVGGETDPSACVIYSQRDPKWASEKLGSSNSTMSEAGCLVTSLAIGIKCSGTQLNVSEFDAGIFLDYLKEGNCFEGADLKWKCDAIQSIAPNVSISPTDRFGKSTAVTIADLKKEGLSNLVAKIESYDPSQYFVIIGIQNDDIDSHFVVYNKTVDEETFEAKDPINGGLNNYKFDDVYQIFAYKYV